MQVTHHESDSPILPVQQLEKLSEFRPDLIDWVVDQTQREAEFRRETTARRDTFIFIERIGGLIAAAVLSIAFLGASLYLGMNGQPWLAGVIGGTTLVGIVTVLVTGRKPDSKPAAKPQGK